MARKKLKFGTAFGAFGASFGMGLAREWQRASKKDREGGFMNWLKGKKDDAPGYKEGVKMTGDYNEDSAQSLQSSGQSPTPIATESMEVPASASAPPPADVQINPIAPPAEVTPAPLSNEQYEWPAEPEIKQPEPQQPEIPTDDYQANW